MPIFRTWKKRNMKILEKNTASLQLGLFCTVKLLLYVLEITLNGVYIVRQWISLVIMIHS